MISARSSIGFQRPRSLVETWLPVRDFFDFLLELTPGRASGPEFGADPAIEDAAECLAGRRLSGWPDWLAGDEADMMPVCDVTLR